MAQKYKKYWGEIDKPFYPCPRVHVKKTENSQNLEKFSRDFFSYSLLNKGWVLRGVIRNNNVIWGFMKSL